MARKEKEAAVQELSEKIKNNSGVILTEYQGLTVAELSELRTKLRPHKCEYKVVKNTLTKRVLKSAGLDKFAEHFSGPTAILIEKGDPVAGAKVLVDFSKDHNKLKVMAGILGEKVLSSQEVKSLASLPPKDVLIAKTVGTIKAPLYNIVNVLQGNIRKFVYVMDAIKKQKQQ